MNCINKINIAQISARYSCLSPKSPKFNFKYANKQKQQRIKLNEHKLQRYQQYNKWIIEKVNKEQLLRSPIKKKYVSQQQISYKQTKKKMDNKDNKDKLEYLKILERRNQHLEQENLRLKQQLAIKKTNQFQVQDLLQKLNQKYYELKHNKPKPTGLWITEQVQISTGQKSIQSIVSQKNTKQTFQSDHMLLELSDSQIEYKSKNQISCIKHGHIQHFVQDQLAKMQPCKTTKQIYFKKNILAKVSSLDRFA